MTDRRPISGFPNYEINTSGDVFSFQRGVWRQKRPTIVGTGYLSVHLFNRGRDRQAMIHVLVLETFVGPRPPKHDALHGDGSRTNNNLSNLRWGTRAENMADAVRHGTALIGSKNPGAKLTKHDVLFIRDMIAFGFTQLEIAKMYGVSQTTIGGVHTGRTYSSEQVHVG